VQEPRNLRSLCCSAAIHLATSQLGASKEACEKAVKLLKELDAKDRTLNAKIYAVYAQVLFRTEDYKGATQAYEMSLFYQFDQAV